MDDEIVIRRAEGAMDAVVDGRTVLLSPRDFSYHGLDPVGAGTVSFRSFMNLYAVLREIGADVTVRHPVEMLRPVVPPGP